MKYNKNLTEAQIVSKKEPHNRMKPTSADVVSHVISFGDVADTVDIDRTSI